MRVLFYIYILVKFDFVWICCVEKCLSKKLILEIRMNRKYLFFVIVFILIGFFVDNFVKFNFFVYSY